MTTEPMVILKYKGKRISSRKLSIRESAYDTMMYQTVLPLYQIKKVEREMNRRRMLRLTKNTGEDDVCRLNLESSSCIYMT